MNKRVMFIVFLIVVGISFSAAAFTDLKTDHWAYQALTELHEKGVLSGYPDGEFKGEKEISRYEMAVLVDRAYSRIKELEFEQLDSLTEAEAEVTKEMAREKILIVDHSGRKLSSAQLEEIKFIVDNLRIEFAQELEVLGVEVENLSTEIAAVEAKLAELKVPEDKIEFGAVITTNFETIDYPSDKEERALAVYSWTDEDVLDLESSKFFRDMDYADLYYSLFDSDSTFDYPDDFPLELTIFKSSDDLDDIPTRKKFWQEYDFTIKGQQNFGEFNLELETIDNIFSEVDQVIPDHNLSDQKILKMDKALLSFNYHDNYFKIGDLDDYQLKPYFLAENDLEALEYKRKYNDLDWKFLTGGTEIALGREDFAVDLYSLSSAKEINFAAYEISFNQLRFEGQNATNLALAFDNFKFNDSLSLKGDLVYNDWEIDKLVGSFGSDLNMYYIGFEELLKNKKGDDYYLDLVANWAISDRLQLKPRYQNAGSEFLALEDDLDAPYGFDLYGLGADYNLTDNLILESSYAYLDPGSEWDQVFKNLVFAPGVKPEAKEIYKLALKQQKERFANSLALKYEKNDNFFADFEQLTLILKTIYQLDSKTQLGAKFVNKFGNWESRVINQSTEYITEMEAGYNYLEAFINKRLRDNLSWNLTGRITDSDTSYKQDNNQGYDIEAVSSMFETSLKLEF